MEQGLSNAEVTDMLQDRYGLIWIATEHGLNRFDGYEFLVYRYSPFDSSSIGANFIEYIREDPKGNIWAVLSIGGLSKWDRSSNRFSYYSLDTSSSRQSAYVQDLIWDDKGKIWLALPNGIYTLSRTEKYFTQVYPSEDQVGPWIQWLFKDSENRIWLSRAGKSIGWLDTIEHKVQTLKYFYKGEKRAIPPEWAFYKPFLDSRQRMWFISKELGVFLYDPKLHRLETFWKDFDPTLSSKQIVRGFFETIDGKIWIGLRKYGLFYFDERQQRFVKNEVQAFSNIKKAFCDSLDNIWLHLENGKLARINTEGLEEIANYEKSSRIFLVDKDNSLWMGNTGKGLSNLRRKNWNFKHWTNLGKGTFSLNNTKSVLADKNGDFWIGTTKGLLRYLPKSQTTVPITQDTKLPFQLSSNCVTALVEGQNSKLWVGTDNGLNLIDKNTGLIAQYQYGKKRSKNLPSNFIRSLYIDWEGQLWIITTQGLSLFNSQKNSFKHFRQKRRRSLFFENQ